MKLFIRIISLVMLFFVSILQGNLGSLIIDENKKFSLSPLLHSSLFWILLTLWIIANIIYSAVEDKKENKFLSNWKKEKSKMIKDVRKKTKKENTAMLWKLLKLCKY